MTLSRRVSFLLLVSSLTFAFSLHVSLVSVVLALPAYGVTAFMPTLITGAAADTERAQTLHLSVSAGEAVGGRLEGPADSCERHDVAHEVGETVDSIGDECWRELAVVHTQRVHASHPGC